MGMDSHDWIKCEVCNDTEILMTVTSHGDVEDCGFDYAIFLCTKEEHDVCGSCLKSYSNINEDDIVNEDQNDPCMFDAQFCPICTKKYIPDAELLDYLLGKLNMSREDATEDARRTYSH